jgi:hypothetical protein
MKNLSGTTVLLEFTLGATRTNPGTKEIMLDVLMIFLQDHSGSSVENELEVRQAMQVEI